MYSSQVSRRFFSLSIATIEPSLNTAILSAFLIVLNLCAITKVILSLDTSSITSEIILQLGWDYGFTNVDLGTPIDNGTITTPINYNLDFGTIITPLTPVLTSSVS